MFDKLAQEVIFCRDVIFNELALIPKEGGKNNEPTPYQCHIGELKKEGLMLLNNEGEEPNVVPLQLSIALVIIDALVGAPTIPTRPMSIHEAHHLCKTLEFPPKFGVHKKTSKPCSMFNID